MQRTHGGSPVWPVGKKRHDAWNSSRSRSFEVDELDFHKRYSLIHAVQDVDKDDLDDHGPVGGVWDEEEEVSGPAAAHRNTMLIISFVLMVVVGFLNNIFSKLQSLPMANYVNFSNLFVTFCYIPLSLAWVIPMAKLGHIPKEDITISKKPFLVMGILDSFSGIMMFWALVQLSGPLANLLQQSAIPISMLISKILVKAKYNLAQYVGALVVAGGIAIVLYPSLHTDGDSSIITSAIVLICSCIPMTLSSVYKEIALGERDLDPTYFNLLVAVFQLIASVPLAIPTIYAQGMTIRDLLPNLWSGVKCFCGIDDVAPIDDAHSCAFHGPVYMTVYVAVNLCYNILINLILKYGSANLLWLALTTRVPLTNIAFSLPFMPGATPMEPTDILGLIIIMLGLCTYRFGHALWSKLSFEDLRRRIKYGKVGKSSKLDLGEDDDDDVTVDWGLSAEQEAGIDKRALLAGSVQEEGDVGRVVAVPGTNNMHKSTSFNL